MSQQYPWHATPVPDTATLNRWLSKVKGQFFIEHRPSSGFLGSLICDHDYIWDETCDTAWCDGKTIAFNPRFFAWMTPASRLTVLIHEIWHTGHDHMSRRKNRHPKIWNWAGDFVINNQMENWGFDFSQLMEIKPCLDHQYDGMSTEEVYALLEPQVVKIPLPMASAGEGQPGQGDPQPGPGDVSLNGQPDPGMGGDVRDAANPAAEIEVKAKIVKAVQAAKMGKDAGNLPGEIQELVDEFLNPKLPWEILLARFYTELSKDDYSWRQPSRRYEDEYLPSLSGDNKLDHLIYYIDVSGSVTPEQVKAVFSECRYIHQECRPKKVTMVTFDTEIHDTYVLEEDDPFEGFEIVGRGGTSLVPVEAHIKEHRPTAAVVFSDLECRPMSKDPGVPILWCVIDNEHAAVPFGRAVHISSME